MDYNKEDKGFVCSVYRLLGRRLFFVILTLIACVLFLGHLAWAWIDHDLSPNDNLTASFYALLALAIALGCIIIAPSNFVLRLAGFLTALGSCAVGLHHLNLLGSSVFYALLVFGLFLVVMLLSWFVYNARSSEINEL